MIKTSNEQINSKERYHKVKYESVRQSLAGSSWGRPPRNQEFLHWPELNTMPKSDVKAKTAYLKPKGPTQRLLST